MSRRRLIFHARYWLFSVACVIVCSSCGTQPTARQAEPQEHIRASAGSTDCVVPDSSLPQNATRIYIALRNGTDGSGRSADDARDGSTPAAFDTILRCYEEGCSGGPSIPKTENLIVCLGAGTFQTQGTWDAGVDQPHRSPLGFRLGKGWKFHGQGADKTTLQLSDFLTISDPQNPSRLPVGTGTNTLLSTNAHTASGVEISDMTLDANYPALKQEANQNGVSALNLEGIRLWSAHGGNHIHDINVINAAGEIGEIDELFETFSVLIVSAAPNSSPLDCGNNIIERTTASGFGGGRAVAITISNAGGEVRNNEVDGYQIAYGGWQMGPVNFHDNIASGNLYGFNIDSLTNNGVHIESNQISGSRSYGIVIGGFSTYENFVIRNNTIVISDQQTTGLLFTGNVVHTTVAQNHFVVQGTGGGGAAMRIFSNTPQAGANSDNIYQSNMIDNRLRISFEAPSVYSLNCAFGNVDQNGNPHSTMSNTSATPCVAP